MVRSWLIPFALGFVLALLTPYLAGAAVAAPEGHPPAAGHDAELGHPVLDLAIWTFVVFLVLLFVLGRYAWRPMLEGLQKREHNIRAAQEDAERAREQAQRLRAELQAQMDRAAEQVRDLMDAARRDAQHATEEMLARARVEIQKERERLHREIAMARDQALQEIWNQTAQLATLISAKAIRRQLTTDDHRRLVDDAIAELRQAGKERQREVAGVLS
jgi:F-type H+-transporting ATPase subunit b